MYTTFIKLANFHFIHILLSLTLSIASSVISVANLFLTYIVRHYPKDEGI